MRIERLFLVIERDGKTIKLIPGRKWVNRYPAVRAQLRQDMMDRLRAEIKMREVNELADRIGIGKSRTKRVKKAGGSTREV